MKKRPHTRPREIVRRYRHLTSWQIAQAIEGVRPQTEKTIRDALERPSPLFAFFGGGAVRSVPRT